MYVKTLVGLFFVLHILKNADALPITPAQGSPAALSPDNLDQTLREAAQTLLAGLIMKGNDLRAELQEEARALLDDPYYFEDEDPEVPVVVNEGAETRDDKPEKTDKELEEVGSVPDNEAKLTNGVAREISDAEEDGESKLESNDETTDQAKSRRSISDDNLDELYQLYSNDQPKSRRSLADDTLDELYRFYSNDQGKSRRSVADDTLDELYNLYARSLQPDQAEHHNRLSDFLHGITLANVFGGPDLYQYPMMDPTMMQQQVPVAAPAVVGPEPVTVVPEVPVEPVPVPEPVVAPPPLEPAAVVEPLPIDTPEVAPVTPVVRSIENEQSSQVQPAADEN